MLHSSVTELNSPHLMVYNYVFASITLPLNISCSTCLSCCEGVVVFVPVEVPYSTVLPYYYYTWCIQISCKVLQNLKIADHRIRVKYGEREISVFVVYMYRVIIMAIHTISPFAFAFSMVVFWSCIFNSSVFGLLYLQHPV